MSLFHLGFFVMIVFEKAKYVQSFHDCALFVALVLFVGAVHEILSIFVEIIYEVFVFVKSQSTSKIFAEEKIITKFV